MFGRKPKVEKQDNHFHCTECGCRIEDNISLWSPYVFAISKICTNCLTKLQQEQEIQYAIEKDRAERKEELEKKPNIKKYCDEVIAQLEKIKKEFDS